ncbi:hypothetical protein MBLNU230_g2031t1 [Neophaeotheca triangularis]
MMHPLRTLLHTLSSRQHDRKTALNFHIRRLTLDALVMSRAQEDVTGTPFDTELFRIWACRVVAKYAMEIERARKEYEQLVGRLQGVKVSASRAEEFVQAAVARKAVEELVWELVWETEGGSAEEVAVLARGGVWGDESLEISGESVGSGADGLGDPGLRVMEGPQRLVRVGEAPETWARSAEVEVVGEEVVKVDSALGLYELYWANQPPPPTEGEWFASKLDGTRSGRATGDHRAEKMVANLEEVQVKPEAEAEAESDSTAELAGKVKRQKTRKSRFVEHF